MSPPVPQINTFFQKTSKPTIEPVSKIFIIIEAILGMNRLPIIGVSKIICIVIMIFYTTILNVIFFYLTLMQYSGQFMYISITTLDNAQFLICTILGFVMHKRLTKFYINLNEIDKELCFDPKTFGVRQTLYNFLQLIVTIIQNFIVYFLCRHLLVNNITLLHVIVIKVMNCFELHYYGHLFSLVIPRIKAINNCMKLTYPNNRNRTNVQIQPVQDSQKDGKRLRIDMKKIMDFYNKIIVIYDCLNDAIKWQLLIFLMTTFYVTLCLLYKAVKSVIGWDTSVPQVTLMMNTSIITIQLFPLLVPCVFADRVQREVRVIKDYLACKLYENTLDKPCRRTARILLALIETRNLSFSLFHMFDIDISLPFKFSALLLTYLIILLQFDKVISPNF